MGDAAYVVLIFAGFLACALVLRALNGRAASGDVTAHVLDDARGPGDRAPGGDEGVGR
ncbi:hypothetical protein IU449_21370 [Nocardia higoensis]|uniref:Uncharacterized protein n=1 Tax=Nocardia higoensis TaxID=228599 RepID=A0ABS0DGS5_9NOCA|nr:hypothetical protein [Nocardia higoensis]MBF6357063.1 hypothetical protein [Nocardia higoensis]